MKSAPTGSVLVCAVLVAGALSGCGRPGPSLPERDLAREIRSLTEEWLGTPYVWGGASRDGIDCSAFTQLVYRELFQIELPRTASEQRSHGFAVSADSLLAGDLVFFRTKGFGFLFRKHHVGVYVGRGEFAHASGSSGVMFSELQSRYWSRAFSRARRVVDRFGKPLREAPITTVESRDRSSGGRGGRSDGEKEESGPKPTRRRSGR